MLQHAHLPAAHDVEVHAALEKQAHDGGLRDGLLEAGQHSGELGRVEHLGHEARAVVGEGMGDAVARTLAGAHRRSVEGEVAALGVPAEQERAAEMPRRLGGVERGTGLRRHGRLEGEVEVLLPADERGVGASKRQVGKRGRELERHRRELHPCRLVELFGETADKRVAVARAGRERAEEPLRARLVPYALKHLGEALGAKQPCQRHRLPGVVAASHVGPGPQERPAQVQVRHP